jgi:hypothetical protein
MGQMSRKRVITYKPLATHIKAELQIRLAIRVHTYRYRGVKHRRHVNNVLGLNIHELSNRFSRMIQQYAPVACTLSTECQHYRYTST